MRHLVVKIIETENGMVVARGWEETEMGSYCFNGYRVAVVQDEQFWRWMVVMVA